MAEPANGANGAASTAMAGPPSFNPSAGFLNSEARRTLDSPTFGTAPSTVRMPLDTCVKSMPIKLVASFDVTYNSGTPLFTPQGVFDGLCSNIEVNIDGNRLVKSIRPILARMSSIILRGGLPRRAYALSAAAPTTARAAREWMAGTAPYAPTTEFVLHNEMIEIPFEFLLGYGGSRSVSELDLRGRSSADLRFTWQPIANVLQYGNGASVTYGNQSVVVTPQIIENRARPLPQPGQVLFDYVETYFGNTYTSEGRNRQLDLQTGNFLAAVGIYCVNGDASKTAQENLLKNILLKVNGSSDLQGPISHADLQDANVLRFGAPDLMGISDYRATIASTASVHPLRGYALMNLIRNGDWNTALNTSQANGVNTVKLQFDTPANSGVDAATYTNGLDVIVHTHEIRPYVYTR